jgi:hypothetical protein
MRAVLVLVAAVLLVLSGCGGLAGSGPTTTPPATPDATAERVPGVSDGRLTDPGRLLAAHESGLVGTGFETDFRVNVTDRFQGEVYDARRRQQTVVEPGAGEYVFRTLSDGVRFDTWGNRSVSVTRGQAGETTRYQVGGPTSTEVLTNRAGLRPFLTATGFEATGVERRGNLTLVTLVSTGSPDGAETVGVLPANATDLRNYEARAVVDTSGRVLTVEVAADYTLDGEPGSIQLTYEVVRLDRPAVDSPTWATEALREADGTPGAG